jgi:hypothetical protein
MRTRAFVGVVVAAAVAGLAFTGPHGVDWPRTALLAFLFWGCASLGTRAGSAVNVSMSFAVGMASVLLLSPFGAGVVGLSEGFMHDPKRQTPLKRVFNGSQFALAGLLAGVLYKYAFNGHLADSHTQVSIGPLLAATAAVSAVYYLVNASLLSVVIALTEKLRVSAVWWGSISWWSLPYPAYGLLGLLMAVLWVKVSVIAGCLVLVPILIARSAFAQYAAEREEYDATVRALIQAVETKDYYTRGHSERVSRATVLIAREWGMREDRVNVIRYAGLLHDVGKLGVPTKVLQKQGKLNDSEFDAIKLHPMRGYEMLREITFLEEALTGVVHHHERMDGRGYPMGLTAHEIPEFARIIMVADAFDSMTSTRSYRAAKSVAEAVAELRKWQGQQFDTAAVDALVRALEKTTWEPHPEPFHGELVARDGALLPRPSGLEKRQPMPRQAS